MDVFDFTRAQRVAAPGVTNPPHVQRENRTRHTFNVKIGHAHVQRENRTRPRST